MGRMELLGNPERCVQKHSSSVGPWDGCLDRKLTLVRRISNDWRLKDRLHACDYCELTHLKIRIYLEINHTKAVNKLFLALIS